MRRGTVVMVGPTISEMPGIGTFRPDWTRPNNVSGELVYRERIIAYDAFNNVDVVMPEWVDAED